MAATLRRLRCRDLPVNQKMQSGMIHCCEFTLSSWLIFSRLFALFQSTYGISLLHAKLAVFPHPDTKIEESSGKT
jgi:hypothetical protein